MKDFPGQFSSLHQKWLNDPFYRTAVVLGLDVGLEGIGVCVRRGSEILYAKTWKYDVPEASRLEARRLLRSARHCRANRKTRMLRLRKLFEEHGLPWLAEDSDALRKTDPFLLRHRAVNGENPLASKEALSIAIRHCVAHRGHDYHYFNDEGAYPWGEAIDFKKVKQELEKLWLSPEEARRVLDDVELFEWKDSEVAEFRELVPQRIATADIIEQHLAKHAKGSKNHVRERAKGQAFPQKLVWAHLEKIIRRHAQLIHDVDGFLEKLAVKPTTPEKKEKAIFYYHRKTPGEMREHFERKRARCGYAEWLGLPSAQVDKRGHLAIRRWALLEFAANRDVEVQSKTMRWRVGLGGDLVKKLIEWLEQNPDAKTAASLGEIKKLVETTLKERHGAKLAPTSGKNASELNVRFWKTFRDLLAPTAANREQNAPMCVAAAEKLFAIATAKGFEREAINACLKACRPQEPNVPSSLYDFRRASAVDLYGVYPQVEFLLGQRVKKDRTRRHKRGDLAVKGRLQRLFEEELAPLLDGVSAPEYAVVEVARDLPRNLKAKREREKEILENEARRKRLYAKYGYDGAEKLNQSARRRIELHDQQNGICPFTGEALGDDPLDASLEIEHLFPATRGGLSVNENLVLTFRRINKAKDNRTPREFAAYLGQSFEVMKNHTKEMRWSALKREVFEWEDGNKIPNFGNTTRLAQLARQLVAEMAAWMGCRGDADAIAARIGCPSGLQTSACRRAWNLVKKDRADLTHHLVDAVILAHIPPREGQNYVHSGGIFFPVPDDKGEWSILSALPLGPVPDVVAKLAAHDSEGCPLVEHRSSSKARSIHDKTHYRVLPDGSLAYRVEFPPREEIESAAKLRQMLLDTKIPLALIPPDHALNAWLDAKDGAPFRLLNGTPVRAIWKKAQKGDLKKDPSGFHAGWNEKGGLQNVKSVIGGRWERLEIWRGWNEKKDRWEYFKRLIPSRNLRRALRALGYSWEKKSKRPWREGAPMLTEPLKKVLGGKLPPFARRAVHPATGEPIAIQTGDAFLAGFTASGKLAKRGEAVAKREWIKVSAVMAEGGGRIRFLKLLSNEAWKAEPMAVDDLAFVAGLPPADDSSSYPDQRKPGAPRSSGKTDFRLE